MEQRPLASVASIEMVEHQETSVQSQGHPLQRYTHTHTHLLWPNRLLSCHLHLEHSFPVSPPVCVCPVLLKGLQELMSSSQTSSGQASPSSSSSLQIRLTRVEESSSPAPSSVAALQIPVQIPLQITHLGERGKDANAGRCADARVISSIACFTFASASDSSAAASDSETITLNSAALQTFEILPVRLPWTTSCDLDGVLQRHLNSARLPPSPGSVS